MPKFKIHEEITEIHTVEADTAQEALEIWLNSGTDADCVADELELSVNERWVEDEDGNTCETEEP